MLSIGAANCINNGEEFIVQMDHYLGDPEKLRMASSMASGYVNKNRGASKAIVKFLFPS